LDCLGRVEHHPALPFDLVPAFMAQLRTRSTVSARALEALILTASRSDEVRLATWAEIDFTGRKWNRPASHMKGREDHTVPLCDRMIEILKALGPGDPHALIFPVGISTLGKLTTRIRPTGVEAVPHGFRSSFRQWVATRTNYPDHIAEMQLAYKIPQAVVKAYKRKAEPYEKRERMMREWARFCMTPKPVEGENVVVPIRA
jgi:integrase